jgi:flavin-dependent dehydrogenase
MQAANYPVKHGVKVYGAHGVNSWFIPVFARTPEWILSPGTTWQVRRSDFDGMILQESEARGATVVRGKAVKTLLSEDGAVRGVTMRHPDGRLEDIESEVVLDCSGLATFLANQRVTGPKYVGSYDKQIAFFTHVTGALRDSGSSGEEAKDNTLIL